MFIATGLSRAVYVLASAWVQHTYVVHPGSLPAGPLATWLAQATLDPALILTPLVPLWAPNGRLPGRRWRWAYLLVVVASAAWLGALALLWLYRGVRLHCVKPRLSAVHGSDSSGSPSLAATSSRAKSVDIEHVVDLPLAPDQSVCV